MKDAICKIRVIVSAFILMPLVACTSIEPSLDVYVVSIAPQPSTILEQRAKISLRIQNLSDTPVEATGIDLRLVVNDRRLARGVASQSVNIPGLSESLIDVVVSSRLVDTVRQLIGLQDRQEFSYAVKGKLFMPGFDKKFSNTGALQRSDLNAFLRDENLTP